MSGEIALLASEMTPYISGAVGAYGTAVLVRARDEAADATVGLGRRMLQRIFGTRAEGQELPEPLSDFAADPQDGDALAALRLQIRKALDADPQLADEVRAMLGSANVTITASGDRAVAAQTINAPVATGDNTTIVR